MRNRNTTTDLDIIRHTPSRFTWGKVIKIHDIGPYTLVEHLDGDESPCFYIYVDGKATSNSAHTFDGAILLAIAMKHLEPNTARYMAIAATKILGVKGED